MNILLVLNKPNRESVIMEAIKTEILNFDNNARVRIQEFNRTFIRDILQFKPNVIVTFPMTCLGLSSIYYIFKLLFKCSVVCFRAEGIFDFNSPKNIEAHIGYDKYGPRLVDYEIFWGERPAKVLGDVLIRQKKLRSDGNIKYYGYPRLERYFSQKDKPALAVLPKRVAEKIATYSKDKIVFFITGFHFANYTKSDLYAAKDLDAEHRCEELLQIVDVIKSFRKQWVMAVFESAKAHPDLLFMVKKHPIEKIEDYTTFLDHKNILYIYEDIDIADLMPLTGLFFHYGSTSLADTYLSGIPSVFVYSDNEQCRAWYPDMGWPSTSQVHVSSIPQKIDEFISGKLVFRFTPDMSQVLKDNFNFERDAAYRPSAEIAQLLLNCRPTPRIYWSDIYFWKAIYIYSARFFWKKLEKFIKKILRVNPDVSLKSAAVKFMSNMRNRIALFIGKNL